MGDISKAGVARTRSGNAATRPNTERMEKLGKTYLVAGWLLNVVGWIDKADISFMLSTVATILAIIHYSMSIKDKAKRK